MPSDFHTPRSPRRVGIAAVVLLLLAVLLLVLSLTGGRELMPFFPAPVFRLERGSAPAYAPAGSGLAAATTQELRLFTNRGKCAAEKSVNYTLPACAGCSLLGAYYDVGESGFAVLYPDGRTAEAQTEGAVRLIDVNKTGLISVLSDKTGYQGSVTVFDTDLTPLFRWDAGSGYPLSVRLSGDDRLSVCTLREDESAVHLFSIDREEPLFVLELPGELCIDLGFLDDGTLCALTEDRLLLLSPAGEVVGERSLGGEHLDAWCLRGSFAALATVTGLDGGSAALTTLDSRGRVLGTLRHKQSVVDLSSFEDALLVLYAGEEAALFTSSLSEIICYQPEADVRRVILGDEHRAVFCGENKAVTVVLN